MKEVKGTSLNSPGGECRRKLETIRMFSLSLIGLSSVILFVFLWNETRIRTIHLLSQYLLTLNSTKSEILHATV